MGEWLLAGARARVSDERGDLRGGLLGAVTAGLGSYISGGLTKAFAVASKIGATISSLAGSLVASVAVGVAMGQKIGAALASTIRGMAQSFAIQFIAVQSGIAEVIKDATTAGTDKSALVAEAATVKSTNAARSSGAFDDAMKAKVRTEIDKAYASISKKYFSSADDAALALHRALARISAKYEIEIGALIYRVPGIRGMDSFIVGLPVTDFSGTEISGYAFYDSQPSTSRNSARIVASWHTHPRTTDPGFSWRGNRYGRGNGDLEGYIDTRRTGYVTVINDNNLLKFDVHAYLLSSGGMQGNDSYQNMHGFICLVSGSSQAFGNCD